MATRLETDEELRALEAEYPDNGGLCGHCQMIVNVGDPNHRITPISRGGRGVECKLRGDF